jgi:hypothetical protein
MGEYTNKENDKKVDEYINKNFNTFMKSYIDWHKEDLKKTLKYKNESEWYVDSERILPYLMYKTFKSQERLKYVTYVLVALTLALLILTAVLIYFTINIH